MRGRVIHILFACVGLWLSTATASAQSHDAWWGNDKALHLSLSTTITTSAYAAAIPLWDDTITRVAFAASLGLGTGIGKEAFDAMGYGDASWRDLAWDAIGIVIGSAIGLLWDLCLGQYPRRSYGLPTGRTANTGTRAVRTTFSATLPISRRSSPV